MSEATKKNTNQIFCRLFLFLSLILISVGGYFLYEYVSCGLKTSISRIAVCEKKLDSELAAMRNEIANINTAMRDYNSGDTSNVEYNGRRRWKVWLALREKLLASKNIDAELKLFNEVFEKDRELMELVSSICKKHLSCATDKSFWEKLLQKVVKINKIDTKIIHMIDGYVLLSSLMLRRIE